MTEKKTTLLSLGIQDWKKSQGNKLLPNIPTGNITELNELIYTGVKLACDKIDVPQSNPNRNTKLGWEIRPEGQGIKLRQQVNIVRKKKTEICWDEKTKIKQQANLNVQLEDINQKILAKEGRLKRYRDRAKHYNQKVLTKEGRLKR